MCLHTRIYRSRLRSWFVLIIAIEKLFEISRMLSGGGGGVKGQYPHFLFQIGTPFSFLKSFTFVEASSFTSILPFPYNMCALE